MDRRKPCSRCGREKEPGRCKRFCPSCQTDPQRLLERKRAKRKKVALCSDCGTQKEMGPEGTNQGRKWCVNCRERRIQNSEQNHKTLHRFYELRKRYGLDVTSYYRMLKSQDGKCKICRKGCKSGQALGVDHCHTSKRVRGLLCKRCNMALHFIENKDWLKRASDYLEE